MASMRRSPLMRIGRATLISKLSKRLLSIWEAEIGARFRLAR